MKTWFAAAAALFAAGDYAGILMPQYFSVYAALAVLFAVLMAAAAKFKPQTYGAAILALIFFALCGMAAGSKAMQPHTADIKNYIGQKVTVYGKVDLLTLKKQEKGTGLYLSVLRCKQATVICIKLAAIYACLCRIPKLKILRVAALPLPAH